MGIVKAPAISQHFVFDQFKAVGQQVFQLQIEDGSIADIFDINAVNQDFTDTGAAPADTFGYTKTFGADCCETGRSDNAVGLQRFYQLLGFQEGRIRDGHTGHEGVGHAGVDIESD